jgi:hypothetical protein
VGEKGNIDITTEYIDADGQCLFQAESGIVKVFFTGENKLAFDVFGINMNSIPEGSVYYSASEPVTLPIITVNNPDGMIFIN